MPDYQLHAAEYSLRSQISPLLYVTPTISTYLASIRCQFHTDTHSFDTYTLILSFHHRLSGRDSSVSIATCYRLDGKGIESRWRARFSAPVQTGPRTHPASCTMGTGSFPSVKRSRRGADTHPIFSAEVFNWVELHLYPP